MDTTIASQTIPVQRRPGVAIGPMRRQAEGARAWVAAIALSAALLAAVAGAVVGGARPPDPAAPAPYPWPGGGADFADPLPNAQSGLDMAVMIAR